MRKIALTGNIASGKSAVQNFLQELGFKVLDTDVVGHFLLKDNSEVISTFADYDICENGEISRTKLAQVVFNDKNLLEKLNSILHPLIKNEILKFFKENSDEEKVFVAIPLLFEAKMENLFDEVVFVYANDKLRLQRLIQRNGFDEKYAQQRIDSQMPQEEKLKKVDIVINNEGALDDLKMQTIKLFRPEQRS